MKDWMDGQIMPPVRPLTHWLSGEALVNALKEAVDLLVKSAPPDNDVLVYACGITVLEVRFFEPHTILFSGFDEEGNNTFVVVHFTQVVARVVYLPKALEERRVVGFHMCQAKGG